MKKTFYLLALATLPLMVSGQNSYPGTGTAVLNSGNDVAIVLKDGRAGTNWNYIAWLFSDGSSDWVLGRHQTTGYFTLNRSNVGDVLLVDNSGNLSLGSSTFFSQTRFRTFESGSSSSTWRGRLVSSGDNAALVMGEWNSKAVLGAHNSALSAWSDLYLQFGGGNVAIGAQNLGPQTKLHVYEPGSSSSVWRGRVVSSGDNAAVVMGEFNGRAYIGGHGPALTSWADLIMQAAGGNIGIGTETASQKLTINGSFLQNAENTAIGIDGQTTARLGFIKKSGYLPMIASDATAPIIFAQSNQTGIHTNIANASLIERMRIDVSGNVGIGTTSPNQKLTVNGTIYGKEVKVDLSVPGPDYVFEKDYKLPTLDEIKSYIDQHKHLPEVPSAKEMEEKGINLSEMNMILLKKVEELTLHLIELERRIQEIEDSKKTGCNR